MANALPSRLHQIAQHADDLDRAARFYGDVLGFRLIAEFDPPGMRFFDLGNVRLLLERSAPSANLYLEVGDIAAAHSALAADGVEFVAAPHMIHRDDDGLFGPPGSEEWMAFLRDTEGNVVALVERRASRTSE
jgi:methylmalonyl-CoA/ethylmalonyl-CoA epimerase